MAILPGKKGMLFYGKSTDFFYMFHQKNIFDKSSKIWHKRSQVNFPKSLQKGFLEGQ